MKCENCNIPHNSDYGSGRFCSSKCARSFSTKAKRKEINQKISIANTKPFKQRSCKYCNINIDKNGKIYICTNCKKWMKYITLYKKIGVYDKTLTFDEMNKKAFRLLYDLYFNKNLSKIQLKELYGLRENTIYNYFKKNNISLRTLSEALKVATIEGRNTIPFNNNIYKCGWHTTWDNKKVYLRSSYELDFANRLDKNKTPYEVEFKRFLYWNTKLNEWKIAIPDFYLPLENKIVEIKSDYTYDSIEINDKITEYKSQGYNISVILNHIEVNLE